MAGLFEAATRLAIGLDHPAYDCCYLALSEFHGCDFVTADEELGRKIRSASLRFKVLVPRDVGPV
jgi:predicted nucleic acid-binding protein